MVKKLRAERECLGATSAKKVVFSCDKLRGVAKKALKLGDN